MRQLSEIGTDNQMVKVINGETGREYDREEEAREFQMRLDLLKEDMGYETQEEFEREYKHNKYPVSKADIEGLNMIIQKELAWIWKHHKEKNTPISFEHVQFSMLETIGRFEEAIEQREVITNERKTINGEKNEETERGTNAQ